jgi:hypothetical protein
MHQDVENIVKFFRLTSGEDIISEVIETQINEKTSYILVNPMKIVYMFGRPGYVSISMMEWIFTKVCENQEFELNINEVLTTGDPTESIINHYYECIDHFESRKEDLNKRVKLDAPIEPHEHMEMLENQQEERDVPLEELQELIKNAMEGKKRTIH